MEQPGAGFRIGEYEIFDAIGHGSMGSVYLARDGTGHQVALKLLRGGVGVSNTLLERFRREADVTKKLRRHPYILTVYATGAENEFHYIAMEYIEGSQTLDDFVAENGRSQRSLLKIGIKLANALAYVHEHDIVHRDIKPANILIDEFNDPLLSDFGVAELADWPRCTESGVLTGTPLYMSPEQARADRATRESDIYALGVTLYEALIGHLPFDLPANADTRDIMATIRSPRIIKPRDRDRGISRDLETVLLKALQLDPKDRYPNAQALARDLEDVDAGRPIGKLHSPFAAARRIFKRHRSLVYILTAIFCGAGVFVASARNFIRSTYVQEMIYAAQQRSMLLNGNIVTLSEKEFNQGQVQAKNQKWKEAVRHYMAAATLGGFSGDARFVSISKLEAARCYVLAGQTDQAVDTYREILDDDSLSSIAYWRSFFESICVLVYVGREWEAEQLYQTYSQSRLDDNYLLLGDLLLGYVDLEDREFLNAVREEMHAEAHFVLGLRNLQADQNELAKDAFTRARALSREGDMWVDRSVTQILSSDVMKTERQDDP